jgi:hypothetical protein
MTRRPVSLDDITVQGRELSRATRSVLELISIILLAWTFSHITNLVMKTESVFGPSVDLKNSRHQFARNDNFEAHLISKDGKLRKSKLTRYILVL